MRKGPRDERALGSGKATREVCEFVTLAVTVVLASVITRGRRNRPNNILARTHNALPFTSAIHDDTVICAASEETLIISASVELGAGST